MKYINRNDREISHILLDSNENFHYPICNKNLGIWKDHLYHGTNPITDEPKYRLCKRCGKLTFAFGVPFIEGG